jgi:hypothetical protein
MHGGMADEFRDWYKRVTNFFFENTFFQVFVHFFGKGPRIFLQATFMTPPRRESSEDVATWM